LRRNAAIKLVKAGELDGVLALSLVVWPPNGSWLADDQLPSDRPVWPPELKAEIRRRYAAGEAIRSWPRPRGCPSGR
jgi:hypothetical protein